MSVSQARTRRYSEFATENKYEGIVVNGYVRDIVTTKDFDTGLVAKGTCPRKYIPVQDGLFGVPLVIDGVDLACTFSSTKW